MEPEIVTVNSLRFDRTVKRSWECKLVEQTDDRIVLKGEFNFDVDHSDLGLVKTGTTSLEYFWLDRWYNVFVFHEPDGGFRNIYCNINLPPTYASGVLEYVDLDIDLVVWPDGSFRILDQEEFDENAIKFGYSDELKEKVDQAVAELSSMARDQSILGKFFRHES